MTDITLMTHSSEHCAQSDNCGKDDIDYLLLTFESIDLRTADHSDDNIQVVRLITKACNRETVDKIVLHKYGLIMKCLYVIENKIIYNPELLLQCIHLIDAVTSVSCDTCEEIVENKYDSYSVLYHFFSETGSIGKTLVLSIFTNIVRQWWSWSDEPMKNMLTCAITVLDSAHEPLVQQALTLIDNVADSDSKLHLNNILEQTSLVSKLISKLTHPNDDIKLEALKCLKHIMDSTQYGNGVEYLHVIKGGFMNHFQCLLLSENIEILKETIWCLAVTVIPPNGFLKCFIKNDLIKYIVTHLSCGNSRIDYASMYVLWNLMEISSHKQKSIVIKDCLLLRELVSWMKYGITNIHLAMQIEFWDLLSGIFKNFLSCLKTNKENLDVFDRYYSYHEAQTKNYDAHENIEYTCLSRHDYDGILDQLKDMEILTHLKGVNERHLKCLSISYSPRWAAIVTDFSSIHAEFSSLIQSIK